MSAIQINLPDPLRRAAEAIAATDRVPLDEFVVQAVADRVAAQRDLDYLRERGRRGDREKFLAVLAKSPDVPPIPGDELE